MAGSEPLDVRDAQELPSRVNDRMGRQLVRTPHGPVMASDAAGFLTMLLQWPDPARPTNIGLLIYDPAPPLRPHGIGLFGQLDPDQAEALADSLKALAQAARDEISDGRVR